jgi:nucleotide-binding universal stress UspA family protein
MNSEILVGYDPQSDARGPLHVAAGLAALFEARLLLATVLEPVPLLGAFQDKTLWAQQHADAQWAVDAAARTLASNPSTRVVVARSAAQGLSEIAADEEPEMIVLGAGRGWTAHELLRSVQCAVCVAPAAGSLAGLTTVAVAVTDTPEAWRALNAAAELARRSRARLRVFVMPPAEHRRAAMARNLEDALARLGPAPSCAVETVIGDPADALVAASADVQLLLMPDHGYRPQGVPGAGSISHRVLAGARCPVIMLPEGADLRLEAAPPSHRARAAS